MADDWETDPDFVNDVSEKEQRWGSRTVAGSGRQAAIDMAALREDVQKSDKEAKLKIAPKPSFGYGGAFGVERDRMDKSAVGHDHIESVAKHASQKDYSAGFGGKYGIQHDRQDKSAVGWDHVEATEKHASQKDYSLGFGGKYGVQKDRQDGSAVGWDYHSDVAQHASQTDHSKGFGGKFGVQKDRMDASSSGWDQNEPTQMHPSQAKASAPAPSGGLGNLRQRFEQKGQTTPNPSEPSAAQKRVMEERSRWEAERSKAAAAAPNEPVPSTTTADTQASDNEPEIPISHEKEPSEIKQPVSEISAPNPVPVSAECTAVALYDYTADADDELTFSMNELITEIEKIDVGWWKGVCRGRVGLFPANYVQESQ